MTTDGRRQLPISQDMLDSALGVAHDAVLVGGQALAFWVTRFGVPLGNQPRVYISSDADFLGIREDVARFAAALKGKPIYPNRHELTTLEGMVTVPVGDDAFFSVDVVSKVVGIQGDGVIEGLERLRVVVPVPFVHPPQEGIVRLHGGGRHLGHIPDRR